MSSVSRGDRITDVTVVISEGLDKKEATQSLLEQMCAAKRGYKGARNLLGLAAVITLIGAGSIAFGKFFNQEMPMGVGGVLIGPGLIGGIFAARNFFKARKQEKRFELLKKPEYSQKLFQQYKAELQTKQYLVTLQQGAQDHSPSAWEYTVVYKDDQGNIKNTSDIAGLEALIEQGYTRFEPSTSEKSAEATQLDTLSTEIGYDSQYDLQ